MTRHEHIAPAFDLDAFNCPNCGVYARQEWFFLRGFEQAAGVGKAFYDNAYKTSRCERCRFATIWYAETMVYPLVSAAPRPTDDLPESIREDFEQARMIVQHSPRAAAALLRLAIQKLCVELGEPGKDINVDIGSLVKKGLPSDVQKALDVVRVVGNESVHPGTIALDDNMETALYLFKLVNFIVEQMITDKKKLTLLYDGLPPNKLKGIRDRDGDR